MNIHLSDISFLQNKTICFKLEKQVLFTDMQIYNFITSIAKDLLKIFLSVTITLFQKKNCLLFLFVFNIFDAKYKNLDLWSTY